MEQTSFWSQTEQFTPEETEVLMCKVHGRHEIILETARRNQFKYLKKTYTWLPNFEFSLE